MQFFHFNPHKKHRPLLTEVSHFFFFPQYLPILNQHHLYPELLVLFLVPQIMALHVLLHLCDPCASAVFYQGCSFFIFSLLLFFKF